MIRLFSGEFLYHPAPLEMSMSRCSHGCVYCFANSRGKTRLFDARGFANQMSKLNESDTFLSRKIKQGFPVCLSNNTDPFSKNNIAITEEVLPALDGHGVPVFIQTKTGDGMIDVLKSSKVKRDIYVTITTMDDAVSRIIEPGAPVTSQRIKFIKSLIANGHNVSVGINPLTREWLPPKQLDKLVNLLHDAGVCAFVFQKLVVKRDAAKRLTGSLNMAGTNIAEHTGKNKDRQVYFQYALSKYLDFGAIAFNMPFRTEGVGRIIKHARRYKVMQDFVNHVFDTRGTDEDEIKFAEFYSFMDDGFIEKTTSRFDEYLLVSNRASWIRKPDNHNIRTREHLYRVYWNEPTLYIGLHHNILFSNIGTDKNRDVIMKWHGGKIRDGRPSLTTIIN